MNKVRIGLIGCGKQAPKHIQSLKKVPNVEIVLADIEAPLAQRLAEDEGLIWVPHPDEILLDKSICAVDICTPTHSHSSLIKRALLEKKDIFCEKPLCESLEEAIEVQHLAAQRECIVMVGYIYRFSPIFELGYQLFREQQFNGSGLVFGVPLWAFMRLGGRGSHQIWKHVKSKGGGAINEMLVHMIDLANWFFGPLQQVEVVSCNLRRPRRFIQSDWVDVNAEDFILVRCLSEGGVEILCQADLLTPAFSQYVEIQCDNGSYMGSIQAEMPSYIFVKEGRAGYPAGKTELNFGPRNLCDAQMMRFVQTVLRKRPLDRNTIEDSVELLRILKQIREQGERGI